MGQSKELFMQIRENFVNACNAVDEGQEYLLDTVIQMREERAFYEEMLANIKSFEEEHYGEIETRASEYQNEYKGASFEFRNGRQTFDYSGISEYATAKQNLKNVENKYKAAWINSTKGLMPISDDGEELPLPEVKYGKKVLVIKTPKK